MTPPPSTAGTADLAAPRSAAFHPVARETISAQIRDQLLERIVSGQWSPGARVPSERDLSESFGVARTSVREAMQGLVSLGVIERRGNRSFVAERLPDVSLNGSDDRKEFVRQLFETRRLLEIPMVELAARRATDAERAEIDELGRRFRVEMPLAEFRDLDHTFHASIAQACGNPILVEVYQKVLARLFASEGLSQLLTDEANRDEVDKIVGESTRQHHALGAAVATGDPARAAVEATAHLASVERGMIDRLV